MLRGRVVKGMSAQNFGNVGANCTIWCILEVKYAFFESSESIGANLCNSMTSGHRKWDEKSMLFRLTFKIGT